MSVLDKAITITQNILDKAGFSAEIKIVRDETDPNTLPILSVRTAEHSNLLIGKNGQNLYALEHLVKILIAHESNDSETVNAPNFILDIDDYRKIKTKQVLKLAQDAAQRVLQSQRAEALIPMSPYERRLVHMQLASYNQLQTQSIGQEPRRRVVIKPSFF